MYAHGSSMTRRFRFLSFAVAGVLFPPGISWAAPPAAAAPAAAAPAPAFPGQSEGDYVVKDFRFESGAKLPELKLHYTTLGTAHKNAKGEIDNAVLLLHGTTGT